MFETVGYIGSAGAATMWMPQTIRAIRLRRQPGALHAISVPAYATAIVFNGLLFAYGATTDALPVVIAATTNFVCASIIVAVVARSVRR